MDPTAEARQYFRLLHLIQADVQEELNLLGYSKQPTRICDFGCGNGLTTYSLALQFGAAECIGMDRFNSIGAPRVEDLHQFQEILKRYCVEETTRKQPFSEDLCRLVLEKRLPHFRRGDFLMGENLPDVVDLAYCKRIFVNVFGGKYAEDPSGEEGLHLAIERITASIRPQGYLCAVEFEGFDLEKVFAEWNLRILKQATLHRRDVRSRGRTRAVSRYTLVLCQKP
jgi:hypothetical protein